MHKKEGRLVNKKSSNFKMRNIGIKGIGHKIEIVQNLRVGIVCDGV